MALFPKPDNFVITEPKNQVFIAPSKIHKLGLFTRNFSPKNTILIEYIGEIIG
jgi:SET domain-containing protein